MDVPTANQSQTPCQPREVQNNWATASSQAPPYNPLPSLGLHCDQSPSYADHQPSNQPPAPCQHPTQGYHQPSNQPPAPSQHPTQDYHQPSNQPPAPSQHPTQDYHQPSNQPPALSQHPTQDYHHPSNQPPAPSQHPTQDYHQPSNQPPAPSQHPTQGYHQPSNQPPALSQHPTQGYHQPSNQPPALSQHPTQDYHHPSNQPPAPSQHPTQDYHQPSNQPPAPSQHPTQDYHQPSNQPPAPSQHPTQDYHQPSNQPPAPSQHPTQDYHQPSNQPPALSQHPTQDYHQPSNQPPAPSQHPTQDYHQPSNQPPAPSQHPTQGYHQPSNQPPAPSQHPTQGYQQPSNQPPAPSQHPTQGYHHPSNQPPAPSQHPTQDYHHPSNQPPAPSQHPTQDYHQPSNQAPAPSQHPTQGYHQPSNQPPAESQHPTQDYHQPSNQAPAPSQHPTQGYHQPSNQPPAESQHPTQGYHQPSNQAPAPSQHPTQDYHQPSNQPPALSQHPTQDYHQPSNQPPAPSQHPTQGYHQSSNQAPAPQHPTWAHPSSTFSSTHNAHYNALSNLSGHFHLIIVVSGTRHESAPDAAAHPYKEPLQDGNILPPSPSSGSRYGLDPKLLPSAVKVMAEDRAEWEGKVFVSEPTSPLPPLATTSCIIEDRGNASPCAIRSTCYCVPSEGHAALLSRLPLGALVAPLARRSAGEQPLPVCSEPECVRGCECGAFMCPAMGWQDCGQRFHCPFCGKLSDVPWQHYQPTKGVEGVRVDKDKRPELSVGSYEILNSQKDGPAALLLAIDVSASALRGHLDFVTQQIHTVLTSLNREDGAAQSDVRVGLMTYDSRIHLYDLNPTLSRPHMLVVTETEDLQLPVREGLLVSLKDCIASIDSVLQLIPLFGPECDDSSGVPMELPVKAALSVLQGMSCPGKLLIFHTAPLIERQHTHSSGFFGSNTPKSIFQPSELAVSLAKECVSQGCGVHLFVLSQQDVGGAWPGHVPYLTGGALHTYTHLQGELDRERFSTDLRRTVETETGYKAQLRIYVSKDLRVSGCYGLFIPGPSPGQVAMATLDWRTTLAVELAHTRALEEKRGVAIQVVLSYSSQTGDRRTRVHTLTLRCSSHLVDAFRHCQAQTVLTFYCKKMYCAALERPLQEVREELQTEATEVLASYRKHCSSTSVSTGQLVLPQYLRALPVYINSLRKSEVLLPGLRSSVHQRLQQRCQVLGMDASSTATHFYPLLLPLPLSVVDSAHTGPPRPEEALRCSAASLEPRGLYLVHGPLALLLWVGTHVPACTLVQLFNTSCFSSLSSGETKLPALDNPLSSAVRSLVDALNSQAPYARKLWVVKQGDSCEEALQRHLVEDKSPNGGASYADFLYHLHVNSVRLLQ
ncbi:protein transport protein Sec24C [Diretmus argenteus]